MTSPVVALAADPVTPPLGHPSPLPDKKRRCRCGAWAKRPVRQIEPGHTAASSGLAGARWSGPDPQPQLRSS